MPTTFTLKNIPDDVYERIKESAQSNRRSVNGELVFILERLYPEREDRRKQLKRIRERRSSSKAVVNEAVLAEARRHRH